MMKDIKKALLYVFLIFLLSISVERNCRVAVFGFSITSIRPRDADLNGDGLVNMQDFYTIMTYFGSYPSCVKWNPKADINDDNSVNILDMILAANMHGKKHALTHIVAYISDFTDETAEFITSNFDVVITGFQAASTIDSLKALNLNITVLAYKNIMAMATYHDDWAEADSHEDWFLHDIYGNRLINEKWGWYAMDVGNIGWRNHYANYVKGKLDEYSAVDGIFADDTWDYWRLQVWTVPKEDVPDISDRWHNDMVGMLEQVEKVIGNKLLIANTGRESPEDYVDACDGIVLDGFVHPSWWSIDYFGPSDFDPLTDVDALVNVSSKGKYFLAHSGAGEIRWDAPEEPTQETINKAHEVMLYCLVFYLLGVNGGRATFGFENIFSKDGSRSYYPEFDVSLGSPVDGYYSIGSVYARDFTEGKVLANPTNASYTVSLGENYRTRDGQIVSSITLSAHAATILLKDTKSN